MPGPNEIRAALCKTLSRDEVARSIGSAGLRHLQAVFEGEFGALEASRSFWRSVDKVAQNSPRSLGIFQSPLWPNNVPESNQSNIVLDGLDDSIHVAGQYLLGHSQRIYRRRP
jgi:hypothetical protein